MMAKLTRRGALLGLASAVSLGPASLALASAPTEHRLVVVILRGAMDGLAAVVPYGDPALAGLRGGLLPPPPGQENGSSTWADSLAWRPSSPACIRCIRQTSCLLPMQLAAPPASAAISKHRTALRAGPITGWTAAG
jgi:uncharacterized protein (DUF1501 family)